MATPKISRTSGSYPSGTEIRVTTSSDSDAVIYFTLDGSPPSTASKRYRGPIRLGPNTTANGTMRLRAIAVSANGPSSPVVGADFERAPGTVIRFRKPDDWSSAFIHFWDTKPDGLATDWPGESMTPEPDGWHRFELPDQSAANLVFSDAGGTQTQDLSVDIPDAWFLDGERWDLDPSRFSAFLFPGGVTKAVVLSMDDGPVQDRRLIELLNRHGIRGTFHLTSGRLGEPGHVSPDEVAALYDGHEVSTHSVSHPYLDSLSRAEIAAEVDFDRSVLAKVFGREVRGHAYPFGAYNAAVVGVLRDLGITYARTASPTHGFRLPADPLAWNPSCHHTSAGNLADSFFARPDSELALFFIYGHSWELDAEEPTNGWIYMDSLVGRLGGRSDVWYATAVEVADYIRALCDLRPSLTDDGLRNHSGIDLWLRMATTAVRLPPGGSVGGVFGPADPRFLVKDR